MEMKTTENGNISIYANGIPSICAAHHDGKALVQLEKLEDKIQVSGKVAVNLIGAVSWLDGMHHSRHLRPIMQDRIKNFDLSAKGGDLNFDGAIGDYATAIRKLMKEGLPENELIRTYVIPFIGYLDGSQTSLGENKNYVKGVQYNDIQDRIYVRPYNTNEETILKIGNFSKEDMEKVIALLGDH